MMQISDDGLWFTSSFYKLWHLGDLSDVSPGGLGLKANFTPCQYQQPEIQSSNKTFFVLFLDPNRKKYIDGKKNQSSQKHTPTRV